LVSHSFPTRRSSDLPKTPKPLYCFVVRKNLKSIILRWKAALTANNNPELMKLTSLLEREGT